MRKTATTLAATIVIVLVAAPAGARQGAGQVAQEQVGPVLTKGGGHYPVPDVTFPVPTDLTYKVEWDVRVGAAKPGEPNEGFNVPARFVNQAAAIGVPRKNVAVAIVVHGTAGEELLANDEYRARKGVDNPNIPLLEEMSKAGVRIILCGQTAASRKMPRDKILPFVLVAPSAAFAHAVLQRQGYTVNPF